MKPLYRGFKRVSDYVGAVLRVVFCTAGCLLYCGFCFVLRVLFCTAGFVLYCGFCFVLRVLFRTAGFVLRDGMFGWNFSEEIRLRAHGRILSSSPI